MTLVCTGCRRRFDLIVDTPYTRTLAAFMTGCPHCGGVVERLDALITAASAAPLMTLMTDTTVPIRLVTEFQWPQLTPPSPTVPYELTPDDRVFLRVNRIDPEI